MRTPFEEQAIESSKPVYVIFVNINSDGVGDYTHFKEIMKTLMDSPSYQDVDFVPIIYFNPKGKPHHDKMIQDSLTELFHGKIKYYYGKDNDGELSAQEGTELHDKLKRADQIVMISYDRDTFASFYRDNIRRDICCKFIGEHESTGLPFPPWGRSIDRSLGLMPYHYGIKFNNHERFDHSSAWATIELNDPLFIKALKPCGIFDVESLDKRHLFIPCYYNKINDFLAYVSVLATNNTLPEEKDILIYFSGNDLRKLEAPSMSQDIELEDIRKILSFLKKLNDHSNHFKQIEIITYDGQTFTIPGNPSATQVMRVLSGFYLNEASYNALYSLAYMAGVSGDNTFERCIDMGVLPNYYSTNFVSYSGNRYFKAETLFALQAITQHPEITISTQAREAFLIYFNPAKMYAHHSIYPYLKTQEEKYSNGEYFPSDLNFPIMREAWPIVADYIRANYNFYDQLDAIMCEQLLPNQLPLYFRENKPEELKQINNDVYVTFLKGSQDQQLRILIDQENAGIKIVLWSMLNNTQRTVILNQDYSNQLTDLDNLIDSSVFLALNAGKQFNILKGMSSEKRRSMWLELGTEQRIAILKRDYSNELAQLDDLIDVSVFFALNSTRKFSILKIAPPEMRRLFYLSLDAKDQELMIRIDYPPTLQDLYPLIPEQVQSMLPDYLQKIIKQQLAIEQTKAIKAAVVGLKPLGIDERDSPEKREPRESKGPSS